MAITGKFEADFSSFSSAVTAADVQLRTFEGDSNKVASSLSRMADSFSGTKLIQQATLMVEAVERIGGASKLTEEELKRLGNTATEAVAKMKALGMDVPANLQKIADAAKGATGSTGALGAAFSTFTGALGALGVQFGVQQIVRFGEAVIDAGDVVKKMADQTGLATDEVQKLQYVAGQSGTSIDALVGATQNLQQRIGSGNDALTGAVARLGINLETLKSQSPYEQLSTMAEAIKGIKDPTEQAAVAADVFGKSWKEILPAIKSGIKEVGDDAPLMSKDVIAALDDLGDAFTSAKQHVIGWAGTAVGKSVEVVQAFYQVGRAAADALGANTSLNADSLAAALGKIPPAALPVPPALDAIKLSADQLAAAEKNLTDQVNAQIEATKAGAAQQKGADAITDQLLGIDKLAKATDLLTAIKLNHIDVSTLERDALKQVADSMKAGIAAADRDYTANGPLIEQMLGLEIAARQAMIALDELKRKKDDDAAASKAAAEEQEKLNQAMIDAYRASGGTDPNFGKSSGSLPPGSHTATSPGGGTVTQIGPTQIVPRPGQNQFSEGGILHPGGGAPPVDWTPPPPDVAGPTMDYPRVAAPQSDAGRPVINQTFNVNGTGADVARIAAKELGRLASLDKMAVTR